MARPPLIRSLPPSPPDDLSAYIPLTKNRLAIVDRSDYEWLSQWNWTAHYNKVSRKWYAVRRTSAGGAKLFYLHRVVLGPTVVGIKVDHIDGDGLNNRRSNLRPATNAQNAWNRGPTINNTSGTKGVSWHSNLRKWRARITVNGQQIHLGVFDSKLLAASAYNLAACHYHGEFAHS